MIVKPPILEEHIHIPPEKDTTGCPGLGVRMGSMTAITIVVTSPNMTGLFIAEDALSSPA
jgi:hypothetical protein